MTGSEHSLWHGSCQIVLRSGTKPGAVTLEASAEGLKGASISLVTE